MEQIATGYKPEFGLGAVYSGINAADVEEKNTLDMIKSFLANSRELQAQPMDMDIKGLEAAQARQQNTPEMLQSFMQNKQAGYNKAIREDEIGTLMQPFLKQQAPVKGEMDVNRTKQDSNLMELQRTISTGNDRDGNPIAPQDIAILNQELQRQVAMRGQTPELYAKMEEERLKGANALERAHVQGQYMLQGANVRAGSAGGHDKLLSTFMKLKAEERAAVLNASRQTGRHPLYPDRMMSPEETAYYEAMYQQDTNTGNMRARNPGGGMVLDPKDKSITTAPKNSMTLPLNKGAAENQSGQTRSGNTFKVEKQ